MKTNGRAAGAAVSRLRLLRGAWTLGLALLAVVAQRLVNGPRSSQEKSSS